MSIALAASRQAKLLRLLKSQTPTTTQSSLLRHLSTETNNPPPLPPPSETKNESSFVTQVLEILKSTENDWNSEKLRHLLFDSTPSSPFHILQITRHLGSFTKAFKFLEWLQTNSPSPPPPSQHSRFMSYVFQAIFELASREPNSCDKLFDLYRTSKDQNIPLTINSAILLSRCFRRAGMVDESLLVYNELDPSLRNTHTRNAFIDDMLKSGRVVDAYKMLDEMLEPNAEFSPNENTGSIVFAFLLNNWREKGVNEDEIVVLVSKFGKHGVFPDSIGLTQLISMLCRNGKVCQAWDVLHVIIKLGGAVEAASCNALLTWLGRGQEIKRMNELLATMKEMNIEPNVVTFGILINHLCKIRRVDEALEVFEKMRGSDGVSFLKRNECVSIEPDVMIYNTLIDGLCKVGRQEEGLDLMDRMRLHHCCAPNTVTYNCVIDGFCKAGVIERAHELFDQMNKEGVLPNNITLNTLVDGMCRHGRINSALEFFAQMRRKGLKGNAVTYTTLINAFCNANNIGKAMELFSEMLNVGCSPDAIVYYTLISGLSQAGRLEDASLVASKLKEAGFCLDTVCYNVLLSGFCKKNKLDKAYELLKEMEKAGMKPDSVTYNTLISYLSNYGDFTNAHRVMRKMINEGYVPTVVTYGALIHAYCLNGDLDEAMKIFRDMNSTSRVPPNTVIYNMLINSFCKDNKVKTALYLLDDMKAKGVRPNTTTYNAIFRGLQEKNLLEKAFELMDRMTEEACNPDYITMEILTEWLSRVGKTGRLRKFVLGYEASVLPGRTVLARRPKDL